MLINIIHIIIHINKVIEYYTQILKFKPFILAFSSPRVWSIDALDFITIHSNQRYKYF